MELRNPFGLCDGKIIMIEDVPNGQNGLRCNCICPACKEPFEARMGEVRRHHFAHSGQGCDEVNAYMAGLYMILNEYLNCQYPLHLPPVIEYKDYPTIEIDLSEAGDIIQNSHKLELFQYLKKNTSIYHWIYNPKISEAYPKIMKRSKAYYDAAQDRMKKEEEERKAEIARRIEEVQKEAKQQNVKSEKRQKELDAEKFAIKKWRKKLKNRYMR